jgi:hypothetical protein
MAQADEKQPISIAAKHAVEGDTAGIPASCSAVEENFYRVAKADIGDETVRGTHTSSMTSNGECKKATTTGTCKDVDAANISRFTKTDPNAFKVSFMLTDPSGGLEAGDNAVMIEGFSKGAMMTNQQPLSFGTDGILKYDPINFELPNLVYGAYVSSEDAREVDDALTDGTMWKEFAAAIDADGIANDWASFDTADASVDADWVVTLPGQYVMTNPICDIYKDYKQASATAAAACAASTTAAAAYSAAGGADRNQLPLAVATNADNKPLIVGSNMNLWDREELAIAGDETTKPPEESELGFSPNGSTGDPATLRSELYTN